METPMPRPESPSATRMTSKPDDGPSVANRIMEMSNEPVPTSVAVRSPVRTAM